MSSLFDGVRGCERRWQLIGFAAIISFCTVDARRRPGQVMFDDGLSKGKLVRYVLLFTLPCVDEAITTTSTLFDAPGVQASMSWSDL